MPLARAKREGRGRIRNNRQPVGQPPDRQTLQPASHDHVQVEVTSNVYPPMIGAYCDPELTGGKSKMQTLIDTVSHGVPAALVEICRLGSSLRRRGRGCPGVL